MGRAVSAASAAFPQWRRTPPEDRIQPLFKLKVLLEDHIDDIATGANGDPGRASSSIPPSTASSARHCNESQLRHTASIEPAAANAAHNRASGSYRASVLGSLRKLWSIRRLSL